ncbi:TRAP transporter small permease [Castellaniella sp. GW247-6E4]|uniref:TRAP transporter small permease n=1 Tax=Castellaniella sp. GW247-6E4 TaxID=3140380 RepID=UPI0033147B6C
MTKSSFLSHYDAILRILDRAASWIVTASMAVMSTVLLLQVFFRYVINDSLAWGWDVPRVCFIWSVMFAIPLGIRYNAHVGIELLVDRFGDRAKRFVVSLNALLILILSGVIAYYAALLTGDTWDQLMPGIPLSVGVFYASLMIGQAHTCLHVGRILVTGNLPNEHWSES